jgi:hypothetical protein
MAEGHQKKKKVHSAQINPNTNMTHRLHRTWISSKNRRGDCLTKTGESKKNAIIILSNRSSIFQTMAQSMLMWVLIHFCSVSHGPAPGMLNL